MRFARMKKNLTTYRVIYGDTDQMGVAYYGNYLRWFEIGRTEWLREIGSPYREIEQTGLCFPVTHVSCRYHRPARYDDELVIETVLASLGRVSLVFRYRVYRRAGDILLAEGETKHALPSIKAERSPVYLHFSPQWLSTCNQELSRLSALRISSWTSASRSKATRCASACRASRDPI